MNVKLYNMSSYLKSIFQLEDRGLVGIFGIYILYKFGHRV